MIANFLRLTAPWVADSSPLPSRHIWGSGWLEVWRCPFDCRMRHEVPNLQSIYLLKIYRNPFTHFLIAGEARCCAILAILPFVTLLILPRMRHEVPNWWLRCAILPFITLLIAEDEARNAESGLVILFSCSFSHIFLNLSAFPFSFLPISGSIYKHNFLFSFLYIILPWRSTKSMLYFGFLEPFLI